MFVKGYCRKCGGEPIFNIGNETKETVEQWMRKTMFGHCAVGWHVEIGNMINYYVIDWSTLSPTEEEAKDKELTIEKELYR